MSKKKKGKVTPRAMTDEERKTLMRVGGFLLAMLGMAMLSLAGHKADFKIDGKSLPEWEKIPEPDMLERLALAVKEERYEDAAQLKKLIDVRKSDKK